MKSIYFVIADTFKWNKPIESRIKSIVFAKEKHTKYQKWFQLIESNIKSIVILKENHAEYHKWIQSIESKI